MINYHGGSSPLNGKLLNSIQTNLPYTTNNLSLLILQIFFITRKKIKHKAYVQ